MNGERGAKRNAVLLNAGAALYIGEKADSMKDGVALAAELIDSGRAAAVLDRLAEVSNRPEVERMTILDQLASHARERVAASKSAVPLEELRRQALSLLKGDFGFEKALRKDGLSFICECKRASPSKGTHRPGVSLSANCTGL